MSDRAYADSLIGKKVKSIDVKQRECYITFEDGTKLELYASLCDYDDTEIDFEIVSAPNKPIKYPTI